jgi:hypothetical protein
LQRKNIIKSQFDQTENYLATFPALDVDSFGMVGGLLGNPEADVVTGLVDGIT